MILGNYHRILFTPSTSSNLYLYTGTIYRVENYPLEWIDGGYYTTYKNNIFQVSTLTEKKTAAEYAAISSIDLSFQDLSTNFTSVLIDKFVSINTLLLNSNNITILEIDNATNLRSLNISSNEIEVINFEKLTEITTARVHANNIQTLNVSNCTVLKTLQVNSNQLNGEAINTILQDLINNNTTTSQSGTFIYSNVSGINGSLENQLTALNWTLIKI